MYVLLFIKHCSICLTACYTWYIYDFSQNEQLREWVQKLCQCVHPLGKCVDFVHEDLEIMQRELARWQRDYQQQSERLQQEQKYTYHHKSKIVTINSSNT